MELNAYTRTIRTLFSTNVKYIVPRFQREYSWTKEEISELWNDIIFNVVVEDGSIVNLEYFIGSLVLIGEDRSTELQIVDGQQRLTTITIFLSALVQTFKDLDHENLAAAIYTTYIEGKDENNDPFFKLVNENPKPFLQESIQYIEKIESKPSSKEEQALWDSYLYFYKKLRLDQLSKSYQYWDSIDGSDSDKYLLLLKKIRDQVVSFLKVIYITVASEDDAYMIFETLNARGKNLSAIDLVKNDLFKNLRRTHPDDSAKRIWKEIQSNLSDREYTINIDTFFRHYWLSKYSFVTESKIYKNFKKRSANREFQPMEFLEGLLSESILYNKIANPLQEDWPQQEDKTVLESLTALSLFQISQVRSVLLAIINQRNNRLITHNDFLTCISNIENFHFKYTAICSQKMNVFEGKYSKTARDLRNCTNVVQSRSVIQELSEYYFNKLPSEDVFKNSFHKLKYTKTYTKDKKLIRYIYDKIERNLRTTNELDTNLITLEHVSPQSDRLSNHGKLGNLIPLDGGLNEQAANKKFIDKIPILRNSELSVVQEFLSSHNHKTSWGSAEIEERTNTLAEYCYQNIWIVR